MALNKIGALWEKQGPKGAYLSGEITINGEKKYIKVFMNKKEHDKQPDWSICETVDDPEEGQEEKKGWPPEGFKKEEKPEITIEDIKF